MSEAASAKTRSRILHPLSFVAVFMFGIALLGTMYFANAFGIRDMVRASSDPKLAVGCKVSGTVVDVDGNPIANARVRCEWDAADETGKSWSGMFFVRTDAEGHYEGDGEIRSEGTVRARDVRTHAVVRAFGEFAECEPSSIKHLNLPARSESVVDLQLGPARSTIPVHVTDKAGDPVTVFWVKALPADGEESSDLDRPFRHRNFPDGIAELPLPDGRFCVRVHVSGGKRRTVVGPFDQDDLPARIKVTLNDE